MGSYTQLTYHVVFATKCRRPTIVDSIRQSLYDYIAGILHRKNGAIIEIGGISDHLHILAKLSPSLAVSDVIRVVKANSSRWVNEQPKRVTSFEWQKGYGAFSVSYSNIECLRNYIRNQNAHHKTRSFQEEYTRLLDRHNIEYQIEHLFEDEYLG